MRRPMRNLTDLGNRRRRRRDRLERIGPLLRGEFGPRLQQDDVRDHFVVLLLEPRPRITAIGPRTTRTALITIVGPRTTRTALITTVRPRIYADHADHDCRAADYADPRITIVGPRTPRIARISTVRPRTTRIALVAIVGPRLPGAARLAVLGRALRGPR